ncbi:MAG UNVERIFIED_CONTAM: hypothetical protein LVR18_26565 [Planctomycetaceae bacterium]
MNMRPTFLITGLLMASIPSLITADDWPQWRGPFGDGRCSERGLPIKWFLDGGSGLEARAARSWKFHTCDCRQSGIIDSA